MPLESDAIPVGSEAPDFQLTGIDGTEFSLSAQRGNAVVLVFLRGFM